MPSKSDIAVILAMEMLRKSGVQEWLEPEKRTAIAEAANQMADLLYSGNGEAMASKILLDEFDGTPAQITFRDSTDFSPTAANDLRHGSATDTEVQLDLTSVADAAARQSAKVDLGAVRAPAYKVRACFELAATPTAGEVIELYWAPSANSTAGTGNAGGVTGSDAAYTGSSSNLGASVKTLDFIGNFVCTEVATSEGVQIAEVGILVPTERYGSLVVKNESGAAFHNDAVESHVVLDPIYFEAQ